MENVLHAHICDFCKHCPADENGIYMTHLDWNSCSVACAVQYSEEMIKSMADDCGDGELSVWRKNEISRELKIKELLGPLTYKKGVPVNGETGNDGEWYRGENLVFKTEDNGGGYNITKCEMFDLDYHKYLKSESWIEKKNARLKKDGYRCQICGTAKNLNVHHITYMNFPNEEIDDLITLCESCHRKVHEKDITNKTGAVNED